MLLGNISPFLESARKDPIAYLYCDRDIPISSCIVQEAEIQYKYFPHCQNEKERKFVAGVIQHWVEIIVTRWAARQR